MTLLRALAVKISRRVLCICPPASRDWARATARELEFVESDWAALRWALGGMKVLMRLQDPPLTALSQVPRAARVFLRRTRVATLLNWFSLLWVALWFSGIAPLWLSRKFLHWSTKVNPWAGWYFLAAVFVYIVCEAIASRGWRFPRQGELPVLAGAYRSALRRHRIIFFGGWFWARTVLLMAGPLLAVSRLCLLKPFVSRKVVVGRMMTAVVFQAMGILVAWKIGRRGIANSQRTIDELDELLATPE